MEKQALIVFSLLVCNVLAVTQNAENSWLKAVIDMENGVWSAATKAGHDAGADHAILYGGANPSTTYFTVYDFDTGIAYSNNELVPDTQTLDVISDTATATSVTMVFGFVSSKRLTPPSFTVTVTWTAVGYSSEDSAITYDVDIHNFGTTPLRLGFRWLLDYQVDGEDGTSFATFHPSSGKYGVERQWILPPFEQYIAAGNVNNVPYVAMGSVNGPVVYAAEVDVMQKLVYASVVAHVLEAWNVAIDINDTLVKVELGDDTCVIAFYNDQGTSSVEVNGHFIIRNGITYVLDPQFNQEECDDGFSCTYDYLSVRQWGASTDCIHVVQHYPCQDSDPCTVDSCDPQNNREYGTEDGCVHIPKDCSDELPCTDDSCEDGECKHVAKDCHDEFECTHDSCSDLVGGCLNLPDNSLCQPAGEAEDLCNLWRCDEYFGCVSEEKDCDDQIECTVDSCDPNVGCVNEPNDLKCQDGVECTTDRCVASLGKCVNVHDDSVCDDGNACTVDYCDMVNGCEAVPIECDGPDTACLIHLCLEGHCVTLANDLECDDDKPCTIDTCDPNLGQCTNIPDDAACDDGLYCTRDWCDPLSGTCKHADIVCQDFVDCATVECDEELNACVATGHDEACFDGIPCTEDKCNMELGQCTNYCDNSKCDDGDLCTTDFCQCEYGCVYTQKDCNDQLACTTDTCHEGECTNEAVHEECDDNIPCTHDTCDKELGRCRNDPWESNCDDENPCTVDMCDSVHDCVYIYKHEYCADEFECTTNMCTEDGCETTTDNSMCNDGVDCTDDSCSAQHGCQFVPNHGACEVLNTHHCMSSYCTASGCHVDYNNNACDDGIDCTEDICDADGCHNRPKHNWCDDNVGCTVDSCTPDLSEDATGCMHSTNHHYCNDNRACSVEYCDEEWGCVINDTSCGVDQSCEHCISCSASLSRIGVNDNDDGSGDMILMTRNAPVPYFSVASPVNDLTSNVVFKGNGAIVLGDEVILDQDDGLVIGHNSAFRLVPSSESLADCNDLARGLISIVEEVQGRDVVDRMYICLYDKGLYQWKLLNDYSCEL